MQKKISILYFLVSTVIFLSLSFAGIAAESTPSEKKFEETSGLLSTGSNAGYGTLTKKTTIDFIGNIITALLSFVGIVFLGYMIYAGYLWMIARGDEQKVTKAKGMIEQAIIGLVIVLSAYAITLFVGSFFNRTYSSSATPYD
jgi:hypothetical protein